MFLFNKFPFLWLLMPTLLGMMFIYNFLETCETFFSYFNLIIGLIILLLVSSFILKFVRKSNGIFWVFLMLFFFVFGVFLFTAKEANVNLQTKSLLRMSEIEYVGRINDFKILKSGSVKCEVTTKKYKNDSKWITWNDNILVFLPPKSLVKRGDITAFYGKIMDFEYFHNPGEFDSKYYWKYKNINAISFVQHANYLKLGEDNKFSFDRFFLSLRDYFSNKLSSFLKGQELELAQALLLGERTGLDIYVSDAFSRTGAMHILAVSGLHIGILMQILMFVFSFFPRLISKNKALIIVVIIAWFYALLSGFSASVIRSVVMFSMLIMGDLLSRKVSSINILAFSAFIILCWNPYFLFDVGFQLSYAAMIGIFMFYPFLKKQFYSRFKIIRLVYEGTAIGVSAQLLTLPLTLYYFHQFPNYFWLTNIALMAFSFVVLALGVILFVVFFSFFLQNVIGFLLEKTMGLMLWIVDSINNLPFAVANGFELSKIQVFEIYVLIFMFYITLIRKNLLGVKLVLSAAILVLGILIFKRNENINNSVVLIFGGNKPFLVIRENQKNVFVIKSKNGYSNKYNSLMKGFEKIYPGQNIKVNLFNKQKMSLFVDEKTFFIKSVRGGIELKHEKKKYMFLNTINPKNSNQCSVNYPLLFPFYLNNDKMNKK